MPCEWPIVTTALAENRHELVLSGSDISKLLTNSGLDERIFELNRLNFLEISHSCLQTVPKKISNLKKLTQLGLTSNQLTHVPEEVGRLLSLRFLDLSFNQINELPPDLFSQLRSLTSLNLSGNKLDSLPSVSSLKALQVCILANNCLQMLPEGMGCLAQLGVLDASHNKLLSVPEELNVLNNLKNADFSDNELVTVPASLHRCHKLHTLGLQNNPLKDNRLRKLAKESPKALLDYLRKLDESGIKGKKGKAVSAAPAGATVTVASPASATVDSTDVEHAEKGNQNPSKDVVSEPTVSQPTSPYIIIQRPAENEHYSISQTSSVKSGPRPYLVACTVHGVHFTSSSAVKAFTRAQTSWHHDLGQMRRRATLATHDLKSVKFPLVYTLRPAGSVEVHVLNTPTVITGDRFLWQLYQEAEADRKSRKQAKFSQLYRYLNVLNLGSADATNHFRDQPLPVVVDSNETVISVPPLTNCEQTQLSASTTDILIEVTGVNLSICHQFAETVIAWLLEHACQTEPILQGGDQMKADISLTASNAPVKTDDASARKPLLAVPLGCLVVRPIRVVDSESASSLSSVFPSRLDLTDPKFKTVR
ncbi:unnamed protein product [Calicophoron daubneyi]|uniref:Leucine-rich repeat-containing protein 47 n=1 Tax=Calicophoron daubneyi TaxID=300641 RepID=A0AAV2T7I4_CALDB